jgi:hypothetical protein
VYSGWFRLDGTDCEAQLRKGMVPCSRRVSIAWVGKGKGRQIVEQSAKGVEKLSREIPLRALRSKASTAPKSKGAASPVSWLPITAPQ